MFCFVLSERRKNRENNIEGWYHNNGRLHAENNAPINTQPSPNSHVSIHSSFFFFFAVFFFQFHSMQPLCLCSTNNFLILPKFQYSNICRASILQKRMQFRWRHMGGMWVISHSFIFILNQCFAFFFNFYKLNQLLSNCCHFIIACWILCQSP
jgi:hypothetical protein